MTNKINSSEELSFILSFASEAIDYEDVLSNQLRALWTAYCLHQDILIDTAAYDSNLQKVWSMLEKNETKPFANYDDFDNYMCKFLV